MNKTYILIALGAILLAGCSKKTLELNNPNQITTNTFWKTEADVQSAFAAAYALFRDIDGGFWGVRGIELSNGRGDDFFIRNDVSYLYQLSTFTNVPDNAAATNVWNVSYKAIFRANQILENIDKVTTLSDNAKKAYIAEAKFIRGINYFTLAINFGDAPLRLKTPQTTQDYFVAKSPESEVWAQAKKDFTEAAADLPTSYPSQWVGRATKGSAVAYLGKANLYTGNWADAVSALKSLTQAPYTYQLMANFGDNFVVSHENNTESVFEVQVGDVGGTNPWAGENGNQSLGVTTAQEFAPAEVAGWFEVSPTDKLFNEFRQEKTTANDFDPRMYATLAWSYPSSTFYTKPFSSFTLGFGYQSMFKKYQNYNQTSELTGSSGAADYSSGNNERSLRYADVLLMLAEALTMQGQTGDAYPYIDQIRHRAQLADLPAGYGKDQLMTEIRHQRMIEFAREGLRFYDLKRWGLLQTELSNSDKVGRQFYIPKKFDLFPIPQTEIESNPAMKQNDNWK